MADRNASHEQQLSDVLSDFARTMATDFPIQSILDHLIDRIVDMLPISAAGVTLISKDQLPRYVAASDAAALGFEQLQTELAEGPCLLAYNTGEAVQVAELRDELRFPRFTSRALEDGMRAVFTFPLRHGDHQLGALDLYRNTPGGLSTQWLAAAQTLADVAAAYLINAQARDALLDSSERSRELALHDGLTGLPNRTLMLERLQHAFQRTRRTGRTSAVIFVDLDNFKAVNDTYGHSVGNQLLVAVAMRLRRALRPPDTVARIHGDEFVILCEDLDDPEQAGPIVARLTAAMARTFLLPTAHIDITASVGVAFANHDLHDAEQVLRDADAAMYQAKRQGTGLHRVFDPQYRHIARGREGLQRDLANALTNAELSVAYQPIIGIGVGSVVGFEAFLRWAHPALGPIPPQTFLPLAEHTALINDIGAWVLHQACADRRRWQTRRGSIDLGISINVSSQELMSATYVEGVEAELRSTGTRPGLLTLDITEGLFVRDRDLALVVLNDLKDLGVQVALDDFGTGYSSLNQLSDFPIDAVKIDRTVIAGLDTDNVSRIVARSVVDLAHALDLTVTAEGVETLGQHRNIAELGCDAAQGFHYARPMDAAHANDLLRQQPDGGLPAQTADLPGDGGVRHG